MNIFKMSSKVNLHIKLFFVLLSLLSNSKLVLILGAFPLYPLNSLTLVMCGDILTVIF